ncbi:hypothetical protein LPJ81_000562 [Coemansia sp. IMI 209127]|nr:hypothetical protein LPJ81_000562 [Coemansia sp. IMI 209127]
MDRSRNNYASPALDNAQPPRDNRASRYDSTATSSSSLQPAELNSPSSSHLLMSHIGPDGKRQRVSRACDKCRRKKVKCDGKHPVCTHCEELGHQCTYLDATKKRGPPKGYIEVIETRLHKVEELLRGLVAANPDAARYIYDVLQNPASGIDAAVLSDASGALFGSMAMAELKAHATRDNRQHQQTQESQSDHEDAGVDSHVDPDTDTSRINAPPPHDSSGLETAASAAAFPTSPSADDMSTHNLNHLEKRVGHLTLDPTGSLRYLGDSSGWYIINHNLVSLESSSRLKKGPSGAFRWPPITTIVTRESDTTDASGAPTSSAAATAAAATTTSTLTNSMPVLATSGPSQKTEDTATDDNTTGGKKDTRSGAGGSSSCVVAVPRNLPPCAKPPMPNVNEQINLLSLYFRYVHPVFPILSKSHLLQRAFDKERPLAPAFMSAVFAAASTYKAREAKNKDELARVRIQMALHFQRAKLYLDEQYTNNSLSSILTLLLMSVYEQGTMSTRSWLYSGMAIRKAYDMGLHRDMGVAKHNELSVVSKREADIRLRAWWGCYIMDIMVSATLGRPTTIRDFTFDAPFPDDYGDDDDELLVDSSLNEDRPSECADGKSPSETLEQAIRRRAQPLQSHQQSSASKGETNHSRASQANPNGIPPVAESMRDYVALTIGDPESDASDTEPDGARGEGQRASREKPHGVYYLELLHVFGHVLTEMYTCKPNRNFALKYCFYGLRSRTERLIELDHELRQWMDSLPPELRYPIDDILAARPARCAVYIKARQFTTANAFLRYDIHGSRPAQFQLGSSSWSGQLRRRLPPSSIRKIVTTAFAFHMHRQAIIQDSRIFIMPFLTFMMFTAGTMHLNNVIVAADSWIARRFLKRTLNVMSRLGAHWQVSYKCYTMLNTLVRANRIGLDQLVEDDKTGIRVIKERYRENIRISQLVYEDRLLHRAWSSSDQPDSTHSPGSPLRSSTPVHMQNHSDTIKVSGGTGDKPCLIPDTDRGTETAKRRAVADDPSGLRQRTAQTPGSGSFEHMDVSEDQPLEGGGKPFEPAVGSVAANNDMTSSAIAGYDNTSSVNIYNLPLQYQMPPSDGISPTSSFSHQRQQHQQPTDPKVPMFLRIPALRRLADSNGHPIVPASPYTSISLSNNPVSSTTAAKTTTPGPESAILANTYATTSQRIQQNLLESSMSLGRFVPSLEFFANAGLPLGIGGPNGQASLVLPQAMTSRKTGSNVFGSASGYSDNNSQLASLGLTARTAEKRSVLDGLSFAESGLRAAPSGNVGGDNGAMLANSAALATAFPAFSDTYNNGQGKPGTPSNASFVAVPGEGNIIAAFSRPPGGFKSGGFEPGNGNDISNNVTPANMGFSGMLIDDDVIRNLPFSGPVSYDLGLGGVDSLSSMLFREGNSDSATNNLPGSAAPPTASRAAAGNESSEMPWNEYLDEVIRMFDNNGSNGST